MWAVNWLSLGIVLATISELLGMLYRHFDIDYEEGGIFPDRWILWGTCRALDRHYAEDFRYFHLWLPSWQWIEDWSRDNAWEWGQLCICYFARKWSWGYWIRRRH